MLLFDSELNPTKHNSRNRKNRQNIFFVGEVEVPENLDGLVLFTTAAAVRFPPRRRRQMQQRMLKE